METIIQYIESMFKGLPQTNEVFRIKNDLKNSMEEKYEELKKEGKSENEAIGIVISEFGNIDELIQEMGMESIPYDGKDHLPMLSLDEIRSYLSFTCKFAKNIALGVLLILIGVSLLILTSGLLKDSTHQAACLVPLFLTLIPAVALFIYSGMKNEQYEFIEKGHFQISVSSKEILENEYIQKKDTQIKTIILSVCLFILSPILVVFYRDLSHIAQLTSVSVMLLIIGNGVYLIIRFCVPIDAYKKLLKIGEYSKSSKKADKIIGAVASVVWPLATAVFLFIGFYYRMWSSAWIIYPVLGVLFGAFSALVHALTDEK